MSSQLMALALLLTLGMGFRIYGLDHKVYWHDEVFTSLRAAGYTGEAVAKHLLNQSVTAAELLQFQQLRPDSTWADTWASLKTHPEHPPLFYLMERAWMGIMGSSIAATRGLSALFGIALFPLVAWFGHGLVAIASDRQPRPADRHRGKWVAAIALALLAISPVQVLYAQEAREYSLWACEIILASGLFWRAMQQPRSWKLWLGYGLAIALGLYTTVLMGLVIFAHGAYLLMAKLTQTSKAGVLRWLSAIAFATGLFTPWVNVAIQESQKLNSVTAWTQIPSPLSILSKLWGLHLASSFIDLGLPLEHPYSLIAPAIALTLVILCWFAIPQREVRWFLLTMLLVPALLLILPDMILDGQRSSMTRYFMPLVLMASVTVALAMARGLRSVQRSSRLACQLLLIGLITAGTVSCYRSAIAPAWWNKNFNFTLPAMADYIAQAQSSQPMPVWIDLSSANGLGNAIALSHRLPPETPFYFFTLAELPDGLRSPVLIPYASGDLMAAVEQQYGQPLQIIESPEVYELWQLNP